MVSDSGDGLRWQPARLIPTAGIKGAREQELRATSALLSVMKAVPDFGRALLAELGGPKGKRTKLETYVEVSLADGNSGTVRPDGVIVAEHGSTRWTALVEVKTGTNQTSDEQILSYVDAAIREGFDGVLIIDNNILGGAGDVPVSVPKSKLRKVAVWQLSWWRIVTEAILQHDYRGVDDPDQAWILSELIAYLLHESSGAGELTDMGPSWVKVRDAARVDALSKRQPEVEDIARKWEQFVHWVALGFVQETGADVTPKRMKDDLTDRIETTKAELADHGKLTMSLKIPGGVGPLELCADLHARMVTTSVAIKSSQHKRPETRVKWILRQVRDAPDDLRIEKKFVNSKKSTAVLLGEVRDDPKKALLPDDPKREPREFTLALARPMGVKKGSGTGSFIADTRQQAIDFYRELYQQLREWRPQAPKLREQRDDSKPTQQNQPSRTAWEAPPRPDADEAGPSPASSPEGSQ